MLIGIGLDIPTKWWAHDATGTALVISFLYTIRSLKFLHNKVIEIPSFLSPVKTQFNDIGGGWIRAWHSFIVLIRSLCWYAGINRTWVKGIQRSFQCLTQFYWTKFRVRYFLLIAGPLKEVLQSWSVLYLNCLIYN